ncbi:hypothetical protein KBD61_00535 [Patescibacteria group bacterium]|nr:hypothetical protein [Patescibacteria group bacterium]MBP9709493.1 hypothetical protein [Patescibacteria group bacterium]
MKKIVKMFFTMMALGVLIPGIGSAGAPVQPIRLETSRVVSKMGLKKTHQLLHLLSCSDSVFSLWQQNGREERLVIERSNVRGSRTVEYSMPKDQIFAGGLLKCVDNKPYFLPLTVSNKKYFFITADMRLSELRATPTGSLTELYGRVPLELMEKTYGIRQVPGEISRFSSEVQGSSKVVFQNAEGRLEGLNPRWFRDVSTYYAPGDLVSVTFYRHPQGTWVQEIVDASSTGLFLEDALKRNVQYYREVGESYEQIPPENLSCEQKVFILLDPYDTNGIAAKVINHTKDNDPFCGGTTRAGKKVLLHRLVRGSEEMVTGIYAYDTRFLSSNHIAVIFATKRNGQITLWNSVVELRAY